MQSTKLGTESKNWPSLSLSLGYMPKNDWDAALADQFFEATQEFEMGMFIVNRSKVSSRQLNNCHIVRPCYTGTFCELTMGWSGLTCLILACVYIHLARAYALMFRDGTKLRAGPSGLCLWCSAVYIRFACVRVCIRMCSYTHTRTHIYIYALYTFTHTPRHQRTSIDMFESLCTMLFA